MSSGSWSSHEPTTIRNPGGGGMNIARPSLRKVRIEMVPLIDSFFLLLAFFVSSALSMSILAGLPVELPVLAHTVKLDPKDLRVLTMGRDGLVQLDGEAVTLDEVRARLEADPRASNLRVAVRADRSVPAGRLLEILGSVRGAGVRHVGLVTQPLPEPGGAHGP